MSSRRPISEIHSRPASGKAASSIRRERAALLLSAVLHIGLLAALVIGLQRFSSREIVAAGPGEGGEGGGGAVEVGVADQRAILGFARPQPISFVGDTDDATNNARLTHEPRDESPDEVLPKTDREPTERDALKTDRPVVNQQEKIFTGREERGRSENQSAQVGRAFGTPTPVSMIGGVGIGKGGGVGAGTGLPGGSEYGRRIQAIFSRNFNPPATQADSPQFVIILVRIARDGRILSIANGRVSPSYIRQRSPNAQVNYAAERAVLGADPLPPFPPGFLTGASEAAAEVWFRYPK
jgi:hypothetical protein